uniref:Uncharacterized protein n=1 Tax=Romanomermis culicivorax TaxID=13658 RepID=A0A915IDP2_ROMCU
MNRGPKLDSPINENTSHSVKPLTVLIKEFATPRPLNSKLADIGPESILSYFVSSPSRVSTSIDRIPKVTESFLSRNGNWGRWSTCTFTIGGRRSRIRSRNCVFLSQCLDKDIEHESCSHFDS